MEKYSFLYCPKIVVFSKDKTEVLLCKRRGERDYDGVFSFIGGKMEITDQSLLAGIQREKNEEVGVNFKIKICPNFGYNVFFKKKDGSSMVLPHHFAMHVEGEVKLNEEYSEYKWVKIEELANFEPKIPTIPSVVAEMRRLEVILAEKDFVRM
jgi:ADP-ribose pyrophosphatase YjhB (NUDIX family)